MSAGTVQKWPRLSRGDGVAARDAQLFHEQRDEPEAVPLLQRPMDRIERHGAPVPAVLVASDLSRLDVEVEDNGRRQREPEKRQRAERVGRALLQPRLRRQGRHRVHREDDTARRRRVQTPLVVVGLDRNITEPMDELEAPDDALRRADRSARVIKHGVICVDAPQFFRVDAAAVRLLDGVDGCLCWVCWIACSVAGWSR